MSFFNDVRRVWNWTTEERYPPLLSFGSRQPEQRELPRLKFESLDRLPELNRKRREIMERCATELSRPATPAPVKEDPLAVAVKRSEEIDRVIDAMNLSSEERADLHEENQRALFLKLKGLIDGQ
jgi:hypothetical protein